MTTLHCQASSLPPGSLARKLLNWVTLAALGEKDTQQGKAVESSVNEFICLWMTGQKDKGGLHSTEVLASLPSVPGLILGILINFSLDVAEIY